MLNRYVLLCSLLVTGLQINAKCQTDMRNINEREEVQAGEECPVNSHCLPNGYCGCDVGFVAGCKQRAVRLANQVQNKVEIDNQTYTFLQVVANKQIYTLLSFNICRLNSTEINNFYIEVWDDNGTFDILTKENAQFGGKIWPILVDSCLVLTTPFMLFGRKRNGETQGFILGLKRIQSGSQNVLVTVMIEEIDFWSLMSNLLLVMGFCVFMTLAVVTIFVVYKRRRREMFIQTGSQEKDIKHLDVFMPKIKIKQNENKQLALQLCSICLIELGEDTYLRRTVCGHIFHLDCIDSWCKSNLSCPVCRKSFDVSELKDTVQSFDLTEITDGERLRQNIL